MKRHEALAAHFPEAATKDQHTFRTLPCSSCCGHLWPGLISLKPTLHGHAGLTGSFLLDFRNDPNTRNRFPGPWWSGRRHLAASLLDFCRRGSRWK